MTPFKSIHALVACGVLTLATMLGVSTPALADANALTDDKSVSVPTGWFTYTNQSVASISTLLSNNQSRLTDIEPYDAAGTRYTVTMVQNVGAYAVAGWSWYVGKTAAEVSSLLSQNSSRLIDIEPVATSAGIRFAVIMVSNTGAASRAWSWLVGVSAAQISTHLQNSGHRLTDLKSYTENGVKKYAVIGLANTGADFKNWEYWLNQTPAQVSSKVNAFQGRITSLERQSDGSYTLIQVRNSGADNHYWLYYFGLNSLSQTNDVATQFGSRVFDVETYVTGGKRLYNALMISNATAETARIRSAFGNALLRPNGLPNGQWGAYVKPLGASPSVALNGSRRFEPASAIKAVHNLALMQRIKAGTLTLNSPLTYYNYPVGTGGDVRYPCPTVAAEVPANQVASTVNQAKDLTMSVSDNRTARGIVLRLATDAANPGPSGIAALESVAVNSAQMMDTFIDQDRHGCGHDDDKRNLTTLADLGKLYERVENGELLGTGTQRTEFWQPMNGNNFGSGCEAFFGLFPGLGCVEPDIRQVVQQEAAALGKSSDVASDFILRMNWRFKPGAYGFGCNDPFTSCSAGHIEASADAGRLTLPRKSRGTYVERDYVFGSYAADINLCDSSKPSSNQDSCAACPECTSVTTRNSTLRSVRKELFRSIIRENLATF